MNRNRIRLQVRIKPPYKLKLNSYTESLAVDAQIDVGKDYGLTRGDLIGERKQKKRLVVTTNYGEYPYYAGSNPQQKP